MKTQNVPERAPAEHLLRLLVGEMRISFERGRYGKDRFDAGYMPLERAEEIIRRCVRLWRAARQDT